MHRQTVKSVSSQIYAMGDKSSAESKYEVRRRDEWRKTMPLMPYLISEIKKSGLKFRYREGYEERSRDLVGNTGTYCILLSHLYNESGRRAILTVEEWFYKKTDFKGDPLSADEENISLRKFDVYFVYDMYDSLPENLLESALKKRRMHLLLRRLLNQL